MITLQEAKDFMQITTNDYDALIQSYIDIATAYIESYCDNIFVKKTLTGAALDTFDGDTDAVLAGFPINTVSLTYNGNPLVLNEGYYLDAQAGVIRFPAVPDKGFTKYAVTYTVGYEIVDVPIALKAVAKIMVKGLFESNGKASQGSGAVKGKKIGDFSVDYGDNGQVSQSSFVLQGIIETNDIILNRYKRVSL